MKRFATFLPLFLLSTLVAAQSFTGPLEYTGRIAFDDPKEAIKGIKFYDGGTKVVLIGKKIILNADIGNFTQVREIAHKVRNLDDSDVYATLSPDAQFAVVVDPFTNRIFTRKKVSAPVVDLRTGEQIALLERPKESVRFAEWSEDGKTLVTMSERYSPEGTETCFWEGKTFLLRNCISLKGHVRWHVLGNAGDTCI